jgi:hypothetical protein
MPTADEQDYAAEWDAMREELAAQHPTATDEELDLLTQQLAEAEQELL